jgi:peptide/nickel transport system substrate-binding protein
LPNWLRNLASYAVQLRAGLREIKNFRLSYIGKAFSLMARREKMALLALVVLALGNAGISLNSFYINHTHAVPDQGGEYREGLIGQPRLINPLTATTTTDLSLVGIIYSGLYSYDTDGNIVPDLADGMPQISADQKQYTIHLKRNVKWHNNQNFTADDVVFTITTLQNPAYQSPLRNEWLNSAVSKTDDYTVVFANRDISGPFIHNLTLPIIPKSVWGGVSAANFTQSNFNLEAIGTGPYAIKGIQKSRSGKIQNISLGSFPYYHGGQADIDTITFNFYDTPDDVINALHGREIQGFGFLPFDRSVHIANDNSSFQVLKLPQPQYQALFFNLGNKLFDDVRVRRALSLATDRSEIISDVYNGDARLLSGPILPEQLGYNPAVAVPGYDLAAAQNLMDQAGWKLDPATNLRTKNKAPFEITIATNDFSLNSRAAELLQKDWQKLNISVKLNILPTKDLSDSVIRPRNYAALLFSQRLGPDPDPFVFWHSSQIKNPGLNLTGFANSEADKLISEARNTTHNDVRAKDYSRFQEIIADQVPALFLNQNVYIYVLDKSVKGTNVKVLFDPNERFENVARWYTQERRAWGK